MSGKRILISGASVAGPALAYWLGRYGFEVTVVELADRLRTGGSAVDFRGEANLTVLDRMGILPDLRRAQTGGTPMRFVDERGRTRLLLPAEFAGGDLELPRYELARIMYEHGRHHVDYVFGDSIAALAQDDAGVRVTFAGGRQREFDLVVGADGIHSQVRRLVFGPEERYVRHLGYHVSTWETRNVLGVECGGLLFNVPGRLIGQYADRADPDRGSVFALFAADRLDYDRHDTAGQHRLLRDAFAGVGWHAPRLLDTLDTAEGFYFDAIARADVPSWSQGRVVLVGDAACGATIGGMGTGTALVAAYVLAGELARSAPDHRSAFAAYERLMRPYARQTQQGGDRTGRFLAPRRPAVRRLRDTALSRRLLLNSMLRAGERQAAAIDLPDYPALVGATAVPQSGI